MLTLQLKAQVISNSGHDDMIVRRVTIYISLQRNDEYAFGAGHMSWTGN